MALISTEGTKTHYKLQFWSFITLISQSKYKKLETLIRWHTVDSWLAYIGLMKNGVCQLFLKFAYWVTAFWIRWPDYALLSLCAENSLVTGGFPSQRPVTRSFDVCFDLRLNNRFSKHSWGWWFETPSCPLWRHCNVKTLPPLSFPFSRSRCLPGTLSGGLSLISLISFYIYMYIY